MFFKKKPKVLVTGGAGFIGSHLVDALVAKGHKVIIIDDLSTGQKKNINKQAKFYKLDIGDRRVSKLFKKNNITQVFHTAAQINLRDSVDDPVFDARTNILGSINILENCRRYGIKKIIFSSTGGAIYGDTNKIPTPETFEAKPVSPYGVAKLTIENYLYYYHKIFNLNYIALRYANVYGPRQNSKSEAGVIAIFCDKVLRNIQPIINGDGKQTRDYVFVDDVVRANLAAMKSKQVGIYNVGTSKQTSVNQLYQLIIDNFKEKDIEEKHGPAMLGEQKKSCLAINKIKRDLKWQPKVSIEQGLKLTVNWFKNQYAK